MSVTARLIVRAKLQESNEKGWTVAEFMVAGWLWAGLRRAPTTAEVEEGKAEFSVWVGEQARRLGV